MASREERAKVRIREALRKYSRTLEAAKQRNVSEADTSGIVYDMLGEVLGYDKYLELTGEYKVRGQYADYAVKLDGAVKLFVEVKAVGLALNPNHLQQVTTYAVNEGVEWVVLTNGCVWQLYHIGFDKPISVELVFDVPALAGARPENIDLLYLISKEGVIRDEARKYWTDKLALSAPNTLRALFSEDVIDEMRKEFRQVSGHRVTGDEIRQLLLSQVIRPELASQTHGSSIASASSRKPGRPPAAKKIPATTSEKGNS